MHAKTFTAVTQLYFVILPLMPLKLDLTMPTLKETTRRNENLVKDTDMVFTFGQQSKMNRVAELQTAAAVTIPEISTIPKLLKSHDVGYKVSDNAGTWYQRSNNFCLMIGIYLPPPNAMQKDSEMGKEWDSKALPTSYPLQNSFLKQCKTSCN